MPADLEAQLRASLPGQPSAVQDRDAVRDAQTLLGVALPLLEQAARLLRTHAVGNTAIGWIEEAELLTRKTIADRGPLQAWIKNHPAGKVTR